jgi:KDO2-lipid IV(A) lauroyltransferase
MGKHGKVQTALEYLAARTILGVVGLLPRRVAVSAGLGMGRIAHAFGGRLRRAGARNLEIAFPEMSAQERERVLHGCFANLGRLLGEFSQFAHARPEDVTRLIECEGLEHLEAAEARGKGVILFTGHLGAWELTSFALSALGHRVDFLARRIDNPKVEEIIERTRTRFGNRSIDKRAAARPMLRTLNAGGTLGILIDLNTHPHEGVFVDFFGTPASTTTSLATLALRTGATVLPVFAPWDEKRGRFLLRVEPPVSITQTGEQEEDVRALTAEVTAVVEKYVRQFPEQWLWIHKRWNTRPAGEADLYAIRQPESNGWISHRDTEPQR